MAAHPDDRPSGPHLPGVRAGGSAHPDGEAPGTDDLRRGVDAWLDAASPPPADPVRLGPAADDEEVARKILLDQLTGQARSRSELATKLARKGVPEEVSERLLTRFEEVGLVDDAAFARAWVQSRQSGKGLARRALAQELRRKGIDDEVAREALDEVDPDDEVAREALDEVDPDDEVASARVLVRRKLRSVQRVDRTTAMRRLTGMLARKGYGAGVAMQVVREELDAAQHGADDPDELDGLHGLD